MIALVCYFYSWSFRDVMQMQIRAFFAFHSEAIKMEARLFRELLNISVTPAMNEKYFSVLQDRYQRMITPGQEKIPPKPAEFALEAGSPEAQAIVRNVFRSMKKGLGYG